MDDLVQVAPGRFCPVVLDADRPSTFTEVRATSGVSKECARLFGGVLHVSRFSEQLRIGNELGMAPEGLRARHLLGLRLRGHDPELVAKAMADANVHVSVRGEAVRVSPHVYNDETDVNRFVEVLRATL